MPTYIGLISDVHATAAPLKEALSIFQQAKVDLILCCGDIVGYGEEVSETIDLLKQDHCQTISGNHEVWYLEESMPDNDDQNIEFLRNLSSNLEFNVEGKSIYVVHASPPNSYMDGIKLLDEDGEIALAEKKYWSEQLADFEFDILIVGHTHQVFAEQLGNTLVVNPGSTKFNHTCAILELPGLKVEHYPLSGKTPVKAWNWGQFFSQQK